MATRTSIVVAREGAAGAYQTADNDNDVIAARKIDFMKGTSVRVISIGAFAAWGLLVLFLDSRNGTLTAAGSLVMLAVFVGGVASGLAGFAFSAIAGSLMLHWMTPLEMVPLLPACSIVTQLFSIASLRQSIDWRRFFPLCLGGITGIPLGAIVLEHVNAGVLATGIGALLIFYSAVLLLRPAMHVRRGGLITDLAAGLAGGITGGSIAFPSGIPSLWYCLQGVSKETQRGTIQPFTLVMQIATMLYFSRLGLLSPAMVTVFMRCVPAVLGGTLVGLMVFRGVGDAHFRRVVLFLLLFSGIGLTV
jgi:hypothetical protein